MAYVLKEVQDQAEQYIYHLTIFTPLGVRHYAVDEMGCDETGDNLGYRNGEVVTAFSKHLPYVLTKREDIRIETEADEMEFALNMLAKQKLFQDRAQGMMQPKRGDDDEQWR